MAETISITVREAAGSLGVSERTVWRRIRSGELPAERSGRRVLVTLGARYPEAGRAGSGIAEAAAAYRSWAQLGVATEGPWPYTGENLERQRRSLRLRRQAAVAELERLATESRPDPGGLTAVDYLRDIRDPEWPGDDEA